MAQCAKRAKDLLKETTKEINVKLAQIYKFFFFLFFYFIYFSFIYILTYNLYFSFKIEDDWVINTHGIESSTSKNKDSENLLKNIKNLKMDYVKGTENKDSQNTEEESKKNPGRQKFNNIIICQIIFTKYNFLIYY